MEVLGCNKTAGLGVLVAGGHNYETENSYSFGRHRPSWGMHRHYYTARGYLYRSPGSNGCGRKPPSACFCIPPPASAAFWSNRFRPKIPGAYTRRATSSAPQTRAQTLINTSYKTNSFYSPVGCSAGEFACLADYSAGGFARLAVPNRL